MSRVAGMAGSSAPCTIAIKHSWLTIAGVQLNGPTITEPPAGNVHSDGAGVVEFDVLLAVIVRGGVVLDFVDDNGWGGLSRGNGQYTMHNEQCQKAGDCR